MASPAYITDHRADHERVTARLLELTLKEEGQPDDIYYLTDFDRAIVYTGVSENTYTPTDGLTIATIRSDDDTPIQCSVSLLNTLSNTWGAIASGFFGINRTPTVVIREVWVDLTSNPCRVMVGTDLLPAVETLCYGVAESPEWNDEKLSFTVSNGKTGRARKLPSTLYSTSCQFRQFKGFECRYSGADTTCDRTQADCISKGNIHRFGGFISMPDPDGKLYFQGELIDMGRM